MEAVVEDVRREVVDLHAFFVDWFNGTVDRDHLEPRFLSHMSEDVVFISPEGRTMGREQLRAAFDQGHGANPGFRIEVRDVEIRRHIGSMVLITYTEWQIGSKTPPHANNARLTSALIETGSPPSWLHIHETWLPDDIRAADPFAF